MKLTKLSSLAATFVLLLSTLAFAQVTDRSLNKFMQDNQKGIIYVWSPYMPLSVLGRQEIIQIAKDLNLPVLLTIDPSARGIQTEDQKLESRILMRSGVLDHFPATLLFENGKLRDDVLIHGYENQIPLTKLIQDYFEGRL